MPYLQSYYVWLYDALTGAEHNINFLLHPNSGTLLGFMYKNETLSKVYIIINPAAGKDEPVLSFINSAFIDSHVSWEVKVINKEGDIESMVKEVMADATLIAVYGGDGSICSAARVLHGSKVPLAVLPGGTANVVAKELEVPLETEEALKMIAENNYNVKPIDMGTVNGCPFLLRINMGIMADMITETTDERKEKWGQLAYGITAFENRPTEGTPYKMIIDGEPVEYTGVALTVTNAGNVGKKGYSFLPGISVTDGLLDAIALDKADLLSIVKVTGSVLFHTETNALKHWKVKDIHITLPEETTFLCDDEPQVAKELHITVSPSSLNIVVPKMEEDEKKTA